MTEAATQMTGLSAVAGRLEGDAAPAWSRERRRQAWERFQELGWPTTKLEDWRQTNLKKIAALDYQQADVVPPLDVNAISRFVLDQSVPRLVFIDGLFSPALSNTEALPNGLSLTSLAETASGSAAVEAFGATAGLDQSALIQLNAAAWQGGVWLDVAADTECSTPIQVLHLSSGNGQRMLTAPRNLVRVGRHAKVTFVEDYAALGEAADLVLPVTEVEIGDGAALTHVLRSQLPDDATMLYGYHVRQGRDSRLNSHHLLTSGGLVRGDVRVHLQGEGGEASVNGLMLGAGSQHQDVNVRINHDVPHCQSHQLFKGIFDDRARGVFSGCIVVAKDAQKTDAVQTNRNLLLSDDARAHTKPQLEIYADDVKCAHGATTGQLDEDALHYLMSRGIDRESAYNLLVYAFAHEVLDQIPLESALRQTEDILEARFRSSQ